MTSPVVPPETRSVTRLAEAAADCRGCDLYEHAEQTVFGAGAKRAGLMLVGEQPGDVEDRRGEPFVGPAGRVLDRALDASGLRRRDVYLTNAVKHFRWRPAERGKRRLHQSPAARHIAACRPWLAAELHVVRPQVVVAMGAVAAHALLGPDFTLSRHRGETLPWPPDAGAFADDHGPVAAVVATIHPSAVLRGQDTERKALFDGLVADLNLAAASLRSRAGASDAP